MGRVESQANIRVEQAQLIDPSAFRLDTSIAESVGQVGGIIKELDKRKSDLQDRISASNANAAMDKAQLDYQQEIVGKPLDQHSAILRKHVNAAKGIAGQQRMTRDARDLLDSKMNAWGQMFTEQGELATILAMNKEAGIKVSEDLGRALVSGNEEDIIEAEIAFNEHYATTPEEGEQQKAEIEKLAVKQMKDSAIQEAQNLAARLPNSVITRIEAEQKLRKTKEPRDFPMLDSKDLEAVRDYAMTVGEKAKDDSERTSLEVITNNYAAIADGAVNINEMVQDISTDPRMSDEDKIKAIEKTRNFFSGMHSTEMANRRWPLVDDDSTIQNLETLLTAQRSGTKDITEVNDEINAAANKGLMTKSTRDRLREKSRKGGNDAIDDSVNQFTSRVSNALIARLTDRQARFATAELARGLSLTERQQAQSAGFLLQVNKEQLSRFKIELDKSLRDFKGGREAISGIEATAEAAKVWERFKNKTVADRVREFKEFTGALVPKPEKFPDDLWDSMDDVDRGDAHSMLDRGMELEDIVELLRK